MLTNRGIRFFSAVLAALLLASACGCARTVPSVLSESASASPDLIIAAEPTETPSAVPTATPQQTPALRYIFLFIGDGMGPLQIQAADEALTADGREPLAFLDFPVCGLSHTNNASGETTDSAAAATAIACGVKTESDMLGLDPDGNRVASVAETLRDMGRKIGILTTVSVDHATPAGFYAHVSFRRDYDVIADDLFASGFDYFSGGGFHETPDAAAHAEENGYALCATLSEAAAASEGKIIYESDQIIGDFGLVPAIDGGARAGQLADSLALAVDRLTGQDGFFIMVEGGRIDYFCHYHDAASVAYEIYDMNEAVEVALAFYEAHPNETLILVTADHETGKLSLSEGDRTALLRQTISCDTCDDTLAADCIADQTPFESALPQFLAAFGLEDPTDEETAYLSEAYRHTILQDLSASAKKAQYGVYEPITCACANLVAARAGVAFGSGSHTSLDVPVYALGVGQEFFEGVYENTAIHDSILQAAAEYPIG